MNSCCSCPLSHQTSWGLQNAILWLWQNLAFNHGKWGPSTDAGCASVYYSEEAGEKTGKTSVWLKQAIKNLKLWVRNLKGETEKAPPGANIDLSGARGGCGIQIYSTGIVFAAPSWVTHLHRAEANTEALGFPLGSCSPLFLVPASFLIAASP